MIWVTAAVLWSMAAAVLAPDSPFGRIMGEALIHAVMRLSSRGAIALAAKVVALFVVTGFIVFAPEVMLVVGGVADLALLMEVAALVTLTSGSLRLKAGAASAVRAAKTARRSVVTLAFRARGVGGRARRPGRPRRPAPRNDDDPAGWGVAFA